MSAEEFETFCVNVTTFYNPNLFWIVREDDLPARDILTDKLNDSSVSYQHIQHAEEGQKVITYYGDAWLRAELVYIKQMSMRDSYICWLLDYGIFIQTTDIYKFPEDLQLTPYFAKKAVLFGLQSIVMEFNFGVGKLQEHKTRRWSVGVRCNIVQMLESSKSVHLFKQRFKFDEYLVGDLIIQQNTRTFNVADKILGKGFAKFDSVAFMADMCSLKKEESSLYSIYMEVGLLQKKSLNLFQNEKVTVGRGVFRKKNSPTENRYSCKEISSDYFCDSELDSSANDEKQALNKENVISSNERGKLVHKNKPEKDQDNIFGATSKISTESETSFNKSLELQDSPNSRYNLNSYKGRGTWIEKMSCSKNQESISKTESEIFSKSRTSITKRGKWFSKINTTRNQNDNSGTEFVYSLKDESQEYVNLQNELKGDSSFNKNVSIKGRGKWALRNQDCISKTESKFSTKHDTTFNQSLELSDGPDSTENFISSKGRGKFTQSRKTTKIQDSNSGSDSELSVISEKSLEVLDSPNCKKNLILTKGRGKFVQTKKSLKNQDNNSESESEVSLKSDASFNKSLELLDSPNCNENLILTKGRGKFAQTKKFLKNQDNNSESESEVSLKSDASFNKSLELLDNPNCNENLILTKGRGKFAQTKKSLKNQDNNSESESEVSLKSDISFNKSLELLDSPNSTENLISSKGRGKFAKPKKSLKNQDTNSGSESEISLKSDISFNKSLELLDSPNSKENLISSKGRGKFTQTKKSSKNQDNNSANESELSLKSETSPNQSLELHDSVQFLGRGFQIKKTQNANESNSCFSSFGRGKSKIQNNGKEKQFDKDDNDYFKFEDAEDERNLVAKGSNEQTFDNNETLKILSESNSEVKTDVDTKCQGFSSTNEPNFDNKNIGNVFKKEQSLDTIMEESLSSDETIFSNLNVIPAGHMIHSKKVNSKNVENNENQPPIQKINNDTKINNIPLNKYNDSDNCLVNNKPPRLITGKCVCSVCESWRDNTKIFENFEIKKKELDIGTIVRPKLLFKIKGEKSEFEINTKRIFQSETEKLAAPRLLIHSYLLPEPVMDLHKVSFDSRVLKSLQKLNYTSAFSVQCYTWPAILRGLNVVVVSVPDCGKSMIYVPALCTFMLEKNPLLPKGSGLISVVLCPRGKVVTNVYKKFTSILCMRQEQVCSVTHLFDNISKASIYKSVNILITTPKLLLRMLELELVNFKKLCHVVLDEAQDLFSLFPSSMDLLLKRFQQVLKYRTFKTSIQMITISREWCLPIENLANKLKNPPLICIGSHLESALYGRADIQIQLVDSKDKTYKIIEIIKDHYKILKTIIICNDSDDISEMLDHLDAVGIAFEALPFSASIEDINAIKTRWHKSIPGRHFVLVCSDNIFNTGLAITDANVMVQLSLPENWSQFTFRFSGFLDNYSFPLMEKNNDVLNCKMYIYVDETNTLQFPKIIKFLQRMGCKVNQNVLDLYNKLTNEIENKKLKDEIKLCEDILLYGSCQNTSNCKNRHILSSQLDVSNSIPQSGLIKFQLLHTLNPSQYYVRLTEHIDSEGKVHDISSCFSRLYTQMLAFRNEMHTQLFRIRIGSWCAAEVENEIFKRCEILDIANCERFNVKSVLVRFIDYGGTQYFESDKLFILPDSLKSIAPQAVLVCISNVGPPHQDVSWPQRCTSFLLKKLQSIGHSSDNTYFISRIQLQLGGSIFVDDIKWQELLENETIVIPKISVRKFLISTKAGEERPNHLEKLYELCTNFGINLPNYNLPVVKTVVAKVETQVKPNWAHLENINEFNMVYFSNAFTPDLFFVKLCKNVSCLANLSQDIEAAMNKPLYPSKVAVVVGYCYLVKDSVEGKYQRAIVRKLEDDKATCFFVDFGDEVVVPSVELKYIPNHLITQLPFQAIECKMYGIEPVNGTWSDDASDVLYDVAFEPNSDILRFLHVKYMDLEQAEKTDYKKYSVILIDTFEQDTIVNNVLLDKNYAVQIIDNRIEIDFDNLKFKNQATESACYSDEDLANDAIDCITNPIENLLTEDYSADSEDDKWDFQLNNPNEFFRSLWKNTKQNIEAPVNDKIIPKNVPSTDLPPALPAPGYSTPKVIWQQSNSGLTLRIQIPAVEDYEVDITRNRIFCFKTTCGETTYKLNLHLFNKIESDIEHCNLGLYVFVKLQKQNEEEWPRLILSTDKYRNISYNIPVAPNDDDSDDDKPLSKEMFDRSKDCAKVDDDENGPFIYEYGSDIDWAESDIESEHDSDG